VSLDVKGRGIPALIGYAVLTAVFGIVIATVPVINLMVYLVWGVPVILLIRQQGLKQGLIALAIAALLVTAGLRSPTEGLFFVLQLAPVAIIPGLLLKNHVSTNRSLLIIIGSATITEGIFLLASWLTGSLDFGELRRYLLAGVDSYMEMLKQSKSFEVQQAQGYSEGMIRQRLIETMELSVQLLPGTMIIGAITGMVVNYLLAGRLLVKINPYQTPTLPISQWQLPWYVIWLMITGLALYLLGDSNSIWATIGKNLIFVDAFISFVLGLAVVAYYYPRLPFSGFFKALLIILLLINPITPVVLLALGVFDPALNFRRLGVAKDAE